MQGHNKFYKVFLMYHGKWNLRICVVWACVVCVFASSGLRVFGLTDHCLSIFSHRETFGLA